MIMRYSLCTMLVLAASVCSAATETTDFVTSKTPEMLRFKTERAVVFKDGTALIVKQARARVAASGTAVSADVPKAAILGTVWATTTEGPQLRSMTAGWRDSDVPTSVPSCLSFADILRANKGGPMLTLELANDRMATGVVAEILEQPAERGPEGTETPVAPSEPWRSRLASASAWAPSASASSNAPPRRAPELAVLDGPQGRRVVTISEIRGITSSKLRTTDPTLAQPPAKQKSMVFDFGPEAAGSEVTIRFLYFTNGLRWIPSYRLTGNLDGKAHLLLQGEVVNDAEDLDAAELGLVVGVPNFRFRDDYSPLTLETVLRRVAPATGAALMSQQLSNFSNGASQTDTEPPAPSASNEVDLAPGLSADRHEALFVYSIGRPVSLRKGDRAAVKLWEGDAPSRRVYTFDFSSKRGASGTSAPEREPGSGGLASPTRLSINRVWQQAQLENTSNVPWTTGACLAFDGETPLSQDILTFTPPGGKTLLPLTIAPDIRATSEETETARQPNALHVDSVSFTRVAKDGTIRIRNARKEPVEIKVTLSTGGKVTAKDAAAKVVIDDYRASDWEHPTGPVNNHSDATWTVNLKSGETKELAYGVEFFVR